MSARAKFEHLQVIQALPTYNGALMPTLVGDYCQRITVERTGLFSGVA